MKPTAELLTTLQNLSNDELLPVARAFSQFLNLANTAEQYHSISPKGEAASNPEVIARTLRKLKEQPNLNETIIKQAVESLSLELVLTAHPTEITRRTLIHKMGEINNCLKLLDNNDIADYERHQVMRRLRQLIAQSGIPMKSVSIALPRWMKPNGASRLSKIACGKVYQTTCVS